MFVNVCVKSKNLRSLKKFLTFLDEYITSKNLNVIVSKSSFKKVVKRKVITLLKSPHVNKRAQEQFEFRFYRAQISLFSYRYLLLLVFLKYLKTTVLFSDVHLKIRLHINNSRYYNKVLNILNPNNFYLTDYLELKDKNLDKNKGLLLNIPYYLMLFDLHGSLSLKKKSLNK